MTIKTESKFAIAIGIWIIALGVYCFGLFFSKLGRFDSPRWPVDLPIVFAVGVVATILGIWLIVKSFYRPSSVVLEDDGFLKTERGRVRLTIAGIGMVFIAIALVLIGLPTFLDPWDISDFGIVILISVAIGIVLLVVGLSRER